MTCKKETSLLEGPVRGTLVRFAAPIILSRVTTQLYTVADAMIVGLRLDANALAAVSNGTTVLMLFLFVSGGLELGGNLLAAANRPRTDREGMRRLTYNILFVDLAAGLLMMVLGLWGMDWLLGAIRTPAEIRSGAALYGRVYLLGLPFLTLYDLSRQLVIGCGESKLPLRAVTVTSVLNICLDLLLVGPMGVAGAALATALSQVAGCAYMLRYLRRTLLAGPFRLHMLQREWFVEIMRLSVPNTVQQSAGTAITVVRQSLLGPLGVAAIAGFSSAGKISQLLLMPVFSLMQSLVVFIAQNRAVGQLDRAEEGVREARRILLCYTALVVAVCALGSRLLLGLFTRDQEAIRYGALLLSRECWSYPLTNLRHLQEARLRGRQQMGRFLTSNMMLIAMSMAGCLLLVPRMGFPGFYWAVYLSAPLGLALSTILARWNRQSSHSFS